MSTGPDKTTSVTQDDVDALWLASRIDLSAIAGVSNTLRKRAQMRLQRLASAGIIRHEPGQDPVLADASTIPAS